jgi:hypothetical protein
MIVQFKTQMAEYSCFMDVDLSPSKGDGVILPNKHSKVRKQFQVHSVTYDYLPIKETNGPVKYSLCNVQIELF